MRKLGFLSLLLFFSFAAIAQDTESPKPFKAFNRHEVKLSYGDAFLTDIYATMFTGAFNNNDFNYRKFGTTTLSYHYRLLKFMWLGLDFSFTPGNRPYTTTYYNEGQTPHTETRNIYRAFIAVAPNIRFSYLNREKIVLYSALSLGVMFNADINFKSDSRYDIPFSHLYSQTTFLGFNYYPHKNIAIGAELGIGSRGFLNAHIAYSF